MADRMSVKTVGWAGFICPPESGGQTRSRLPTLRKLFVLGLCLGLSLPVWCEETGIRILRAELARQDDRHRLDADVEYRLTDTADAALRNGVPLVFLLKLAIYETPRHWWEGPVVGQRRLFRVHYHSLAKLFQWTQDNADSTHGFAKLGALFEDLGAIRRMDIDTPDLHRGVSYEAEMSITLDIESLPLPLRPVAYLSPSWYLASPVYTWPFVD